MLELSPGSLGLAQIEELYRSPGPFRIDQPAMDAVARSADRLGAALGSGEAIYGVNSGTFAVVRKGTIISPEQLDACELDALEMPSVESELRSLLPHATQPKFVVQWQWRPGDLVIWDNRCTMHAATGFDHERHAREMWRTTIVCERE